MYICRSGESRSLRKFSFLHSLLSAAANDLHEINMWKTSLVVDMVQPCTIVLHLLVPSDYTWPRVTCLKSCLKVCQLWGAITPKTREEFSTLLELCGEVWAIDSGLSILIPSSFVNSRWCVTSLCIIVVISRACESCTLPLPLLRCHAYSTLTCL